jgi:hypothetical protein
MCTTLRWLDTITLLGLPRLTPARLLPIEALLRQRGYDNARVVAAIIDYLDATGSAEGFVGLDEADRADVEALLPATECHDGCRRCQDEQAFRTRLLVPTNTR